MPLRIPVRPAASALIAALLLAACAAPPPVIAPPPPPPVPMTSLSPKVIQLASAYRYYMVRSAGITPDFADGTGVARSLEAGAAYEPGQLVRGVIAYAAVTALQDKSFVDGVRIYAKDPTQRRQIAHEILKDPAYVVGIAGSASAAGLVKATLGGEGQQLYDGGKAVKQSAYDIQKQAWSKADVPARDVRLANAKQLSSAAMLGDVGRRRGCSRPPWAWRRSPPPAPQARPTRPRSSGAWLWRRSRP